MASYHWLKRTLEIQNYDSWQNSYSFPDLLPQCDNNIEVQGRRRTHLSTAVYGLHNSDNK